MNLAFALLTKPWRRVLVVDDNADLANAYAELLRRVGCEALAAYGGRQAMHLAASARPDAAILDINMPDIDGYELARRLREAHGPGLLLIAWTAGVDENGPALSRAVGFDHHLTKPVAFQDILALLGSGNPSRSIACGE